MEKGSLATVGERWASRITALGTAEMPEWRRATVQDAQKGRHAKDFIGSDGNIAQKRCRGAGGTVGHRREHWRSADGCKSSAEMTGRRRDAIQSFRVADICKGTSGAAGEKWESAAKGPERCWGR